MDVEADLTEEREFMKDFIRRTTKMQIVINSMRSSLIENQNNVKFKSSFLWVSRRFLFKLLLLFGFFPDYETYCLFLQKISLEQRTIQLLSALCIDRLVNGQIELSKGLYEIADIVKSTNAAISELFQAEEQERAFFHQYSSYSSESSPVVACIFEILSNLPSSLFEKYYNSLVGYLFLKWFRKSTETEKSTKIKGVTYTPRIIARVMAELSIKRLIDSRFKIDLHKIEDEASERCLEVYDYLNRITICDNACGCGIFLIEITKYIEDLSRKLLGIIKTKTEQSVATSKKEVSKLNRLVFYEILKHSIYGVDLDVKSILITRFLFLSELIKKGINISEMANELNEILMTHLIMGDGMIGFPVPDDRCNKAIENPWNTENKKIKSALNTNQQYSTKDINDYFEDVLNERLQHIKKDIIVDGLRKEAIYCKIMSKSFHWNVQFPTIFQQEGFDLIIGNPPYIRQELLNLKLKANGFALKDIYAAILNGTLGADFSIAKTSDLSILFLIRSLQLINTQGLVSYIITDKWIQRNYGAVYRKFLLENTIIQDLIDVSQFSIFSEVNIDPVIIQVSRKEFNGENKENNHSIRYYKPESLSRFEYIPTLIDSNQFSHNKWFFDVNSISPLKSIIEAKGIPIERSDIKIWFGIKTGFNDAFLIDDALKEKIVKSTPDVRELVKPVLRGRDILPYQILDRKRWLIVIPRGFTKERFKAEYEHHFQASIDSVDQKKLKDPKIVNFFENKFAESFPELYHHLKSFENNSGRGRGLMVRDDYGDFWWELRSCGYYHEYEKPKIIWQEITRQPAFYFDIGGYYGLAKTFIMSSAQPKVHTLILNSTLSKWMIRWYGTTLKKTVEYKKRYVEKFPLVSAPDDLIKYYDFICDILHLLAKSEEKKPLFEYFYRIADCMVLFLYFKDSDIEDRFRFPCSDSFVGLFSIFEQYIASFNNALSSPKNRNVKKQEKKTMSTNEKDSRLSDLSDLKVKITEFDRITNFFDTLAGWETFRRLSEIF